MEEQKSPLAATFRACARTALEQRGFVVRKKAGLGVAPGARLRIHRPGQTQQNVVVRVSKKRTIGIKRHRWSGKWFEVPRLNEVVVVSPSLNDPKIADVYGFDAAVLVQIFDTLDTMRNGPFTSERELNFPIFVALDPLESDGSNRISSNLIEKSSWQAEILLPESTAYASIDLGDVVAANAASNSKVNPEGFIERVRREFAEINGVDVSKVTVNFQIVG
jgi:hypothetical protein